MVSADRRIRRADSLDAGTWQDEGFFQINSKVKNDHGVRL
jgi:hypothetical protein